jgi:hypothetical protein
VRAGLTTFVVDGLCSSVRPPTFSIRWWMQFFGHVPFVGVPIVAAARGKAP